MNVKELEGDLAAIDKAIQRSSADATTQRLLGEIIEWNRGFVKQAAAGAGGKLAERVEVLEGAVEGILEDAEEGIFVDTAQPIVAAFEHARLVHAAVGAWIAGGSSGLDDVTAKKFTQLLKTAEAAITGAIALVAEITIPDDDEDEDEDEDEAAQGEGGAEDAEDDDAEDEEGDDAEESE